MTASLSVSSKKLSASLARRIGRAAVVGLIVVGTFAALDAEAKRMGGGRSVGRQSQTVQQRSASPAQQPMQQQSTQPSQLQRPATAQPAPAAAASNRSRWLGPIAGLAAGLGIAALLSHFGLGEAFAGAMANFIVIALIAMAAIWLIRKFMSRRRQNEPAYGGAGATSMNAGGMGSGYPQEPRYAQPAAAGAFGSSSAGFGAAPEVSAAPSVPAGFDTEAFLRSAKVNFVRLQAAWDEGNLADIREFTTPEMFAELKIDIDGRGAERNQTDVVQLDAQLIEVVDRGSEYFASVRFSGLIRETAAAAAEPFAEVWNLSRASRAGEGWLLAGIQQLTAH
ncbi:Tim44 domain-containing protein [Trinickia terrae]|uniref:Tim44 domain-containing protein n=1 Tax=Trinickia terrae TaxID=2571161 RepID=A0A4U1I884_9BURK|nr:TIM44-like domain-containing protein [Trinickia terrae]TKC89649.1 Tim44 domain-containing protein [Trinickia terrae]